MPVPRTWISERSLRLFLLSTAGIMTTVGMAKVFSVFSGTRLLSVLDPIFVIQFRYLMLAAGLAEIVIAIVCFFGKRQTLAIVLVAWLSANFVVYRFGLWWMGWHRPCGCLGNLTDALHISPQSADNIMKVVLAYLLIGSYGLLLWEWRQRKRDDKGPRSGPASATIPG